MANHSLTKRFALITGLAVTLLINPAEIYATAFSFGAVGDMGSGGSFASNMKMVGSQSITAADPLNFFLAEGDLSYASVSPNAWCQAVKDNINSGAGKSIGDAFGNNYPYQMVAGNHDDDVSNALIDDFTKCLPNRMPNMVLSPNYSGPSGTSNYGKEYYFDYPTAGTPVARFIFISPNMSFTNGGSYSYSKGSARYNWVQTTIDSARNAGIPWVVANMHVNAISTGTKSDEVGADLMNLLLSKDSSGRQRVDLILQGHDHNYQRTFGLAVGQTGCSALTFSGFNGNCIVSNSNTTTKGTGTVVMINGTGGNGLYTISSGDTENKYFAAWMGSTSGSDSNPSGGNGTYGITKFTVSDSPLSLTAKFLRSSGGNYTDSFSILGGNLPTNPPNSPVPSRTPTPIKSPTPTKSPTPYPTCPTLTPPICIGGKIIAGTPTPGLCPYNICITYTPTPPQTAKPGDGNLDGKVDGLDYVIWLNHYNQNVSGPANGDFNSSGFVDGIDYVIWLSNYGT